MLQKGAWTFRYSLEGYLKRKLSVSAAPLTESELIEAVLCDWAGQEEKARESLPDRIRASLRARGGAFRSVEQDRFALKTDSGDELQGRAYAFLKETGRPQKQGEILRHLQHVTGRGRGDLMSRLDLDSDARFVRLESGEWLLTEWNLINDAIADIMVEMGQRKAGLDDLLELFGTDKTLPEEANPIFLPDLDSRFSVVDGQVECLLVESQAAAAAAPAADAPSIISHEATIEASKAEAKEENKETTTEGTDMNATATLETTAGKETLTQVPTSQVVDTVLAQLSQAAAELQARNQGIPNEVMALFNEENLTGIEALMGQRKRIEAFAEDLQTLVRKWTEGNAE